MPIAAMEREHLSAGDILERIREITDNLTLPEDACNTFAVTYSELDEFEKDLHRHIFLENSILFPKAIAMEENLKKQ
jgi:regulator of cell morphogenesis and NO signaling